MGPRMLTISGRGTVEHWIGVDNKKSWVVASEAYNAILSRLDVPGMDDGVKLGEDMEPICSLQLPRLPRRRGLYKHHRLMYL